MRSISCAHRTCSLFVASFATALSCGCGGPDERPPEPPAPAEAAKAVAAPGAELGAAYAQAIATLPEFTVEKGSSWSGLTLEGGKLGTRQAETSHPADEVIAQLETVQETVKTLLSLSERSDRFPDCGAPGGNSLDGDINACRAARDAARLLHSDAIRLFAAGKAEDAASRIAAGIGIVRQLAASDSAANTNAMSVFMLISEPLRPMIEGTGGQRLDAVSISIVRSAFERLDPDAPFGRALPPEISESATAGYEAARELLGSA